MKITRYFIYILLIIFSCKSDEQVISPSSEKKLTIFFVNDQHGQLNNFAKIKHIVDSERAENDVLVMSAGDIFSGNPIVDQYSEKGYPIIDVMNEVGFDISVLGNHEFDYGLSILKDRMQQSDFEWVCANVDVQSSVLPQPAAYTTLTVGDLRISVLGLVETNGKPDDIIPATHPWRVSELQFQRFADVVGQYTNIKNQEEADLYIALTHLGTQSDFDLASEFSIFDMIIGGHTNQVFDESVNETLVVQSGSYLSHLGKVELTIKNKSIESYEADFIDLNDYSEVDEELKSLIDSYNNAQEFDEVIGYSPTFLDRSELGCFYTTALQQYMQVDVSIQNSGGIRANINEGDITTLEIYNMDPFNNGSVVFTMTVEEIKQFFQQTGAGLHITGITMENSQEGFKIFDANGNELQNSDQLTVGTNDYIPAVYDDYFSIEDADIRTLTTAETIIEYLKTTSDEMAYEDCNRFFRY